MSTEQRREKIHELRRMGVGVPPYVYGDLDKDAPSTTVTQWPWFAHVWSRPTARTWADKNPILLERAREAWDRSETTVNDALARRRERDTAKAEQQAAQEAEFKARRDERSAALDERLKREFLATPGTTDADWERSRDRIREEHFLREAERANAEARSQTRRLVHGL